MTNTVRAAMIGCGSMARYHIQTMLKQRDTTEITAVSEPSETAYALTAKLFRDAGLAAPPNQPDLHKLLADYALDAAFIVTPHAFHHDQAVACLEQGLDVLLEKPMVMSGAEATSLIETRDRTGKLLIVAFPGSLSPQIRAAAQMIRSGEIGSLLSISATVWQDWGPNTTGTWRQQPELSGGGFLFDTGAHMLNTVVDLAGEEFSEVAAWFDYNGRPVETLAVVIGRLLPRARDVQDVGRVAVAGRRVTGGQLVAPANGIDAQRKHRRDQEEEALGLLAERHVDEVRLEDEARRVGDHRDGRAEEQPAGHVRGLSGLAVSPRPHGADQTRPQDAQAERAGSAAHRDLRHRRVPRGCGEVLCEGLWLCRHRSGRHQQPERGEAAVEGRF